MHKDELSTLRENLKRARKLVVSSPRDQRAEREAEVERLERAVKRAESAVNRDKRERVEQEAIASATREEKEKRKHGKGAFYLKDGMSCPVLAPYIMWLTCHYSRQKEATSQSSLRSYGCRGRQACCQESYREEAKEDQPEGDQSEAICTRKRRGSVYRK